MCISHLLHVQVNKIAPPPCSAQIDGVPCGAPALTENAFVFTLRSNRPDEGGRQVAVTLATPLCAEHAILANDLFRDLFGAFVAPEDAGAPGMHVMIQTPAEG